MSPLAGLSLGAESRAREIADQLARLEAAAGEAAAQRHRLRLAVARAEELRIQVLDHRAAVRGHVMVSAFQESSDLYGRLRSIETQMEGMEARRAGLHEELAHIEQIRQMTAELGRDHAIRAVTADDPRVICRRAERQLLQLVVQDHEAIAQQFLTGPMEELADVALAVELIGRRVGRDPAVTVAERITRCREATETALDLMQRLLFRICPIGLADDGLVKSVRRVAEDLAGTVAVRVEVIGEERKLPPAVALAAFRVVAESVDNAWRHGQAKEVEVVLGFGHNRLQGVVSDNGEGFDVSGTEARLGRTQSLGLISMRERVENLGGSLEVRSVLGAGTEVRMVFHTAPAAAAGRAAPA
ncbi:MAG: ATP-binding protein [Candidatus Dormibacteria bacterium]